jgi:hypothetical protein
MPEELKSYTCEDLRLWNSMIQLRKTFWIMIYGPKGAGKNTLCRQLLYDMWPRLWDHHVIWVTETGRVNPDQIKWIPPSCIRTDVENLDAILQGIFDLQEERMKANGGGIGIGSKGKKKKKKETGGRNRSATKSKGYGDKSLGEKPKKGPKETKDGEKQRGENTGKKRKRDTLASGDCRPKKRKKYDEDALMEQHMKEANDRNIKELVNALKNQSSVPEQKLEELKEKAKEYIGDPHETLESCTKVLLVLDDCCGSDTVRYCKNFKTLSNNQRHRQISVIVLSQSIRGSNSVPPAIRDNCDTVIVCKHYRNEASRDLVASEYMTASNKGKKGLEQAKDLLADINKIPHRAAVIDVAADSLDMRDYVYYYGPVCEDFPFPEWKIGLEDQWTDENKKQEGGNGKGNSGGRKNVNSAGPGGEKKFVKHGRERLPVAGGVVVSEEPNFFRRQRFRRHRGLQEQVQQGNFTELGVVPTRNFQGYNFSTSLRRGLEPYRLRTGELSNNNRF